MACWQGCHICLGRETAWVQHSFSRALNREPIHVVGHRTESPTDQPVFSNNPLPSFSGGASARLDLWISCVWRECESDPSLENGELWQTWAFALHMPPQCWLEKLLQRLLYKVSVKHSVLFSFFFSVSVKCNKTVNKLFYSIYFRVLGQARCCPTFCVPPAQQDSSPSPVNLWIHARFWIWICLFHTIDPFCTHLNTATKKNRHTCTPP